MRMMPAGVPTPTTAPPASPPSGPRSMIQSAARTTSRLCSMTSSEWPASISRLKERSSFATSSKCRPVVGSSNRNSEPRASAGAALAHRVLRQMAGELQPLRLPAREGGHGLAESQVVEPHLHERREAQAHLGVGAKHRQRLGNRELEDVRDGERREAVARQLAFEDLRAIAPAVAVGAAQIHIRQKLHLHVLEAVAAAARAAAVAGVEAEGAGGVLALAGLRQSCEQAADGIEGADVARGIGARGAADAALIDHDDLRRCSSTPCKAPMPAGILGGLALGALQRGEQHIVHQRRLAGAADAGHADQALERYLDVDVLEIVLAGALDAQTPGGGALRRRMRRIDAPAVKQIIGGERALRRGELGDAPVEDDLAAVLAGAGPDVEQPVGRLHHLRIVLDHDQRIARIAQPLHDADDSTDIACMQADGGLVQHEQGVDQRGAERRGQIDPLHLAAGQRARLAVEIEVPQADVGRDSRGARGFRAATDRWPHRAARARRGCAKKRRHSSIGSSINSRMLTPGSPTRHSSASGFRRAPRQAVHSVYERYLESSTRMCILYALVSSQAKNRFTPYQTFLVHSPSPSSTQARSRVGELAPGRIDRDAALAGELEQIRLALLVGFGLPGLDGALAQRQGRVRNDQAVVDADAAAEAAAHVAGADRGIEAEGARTRILVGDVAVRHSADRWRIAKAPPAPPLRRLADRRRAVPARP